MTVIDWIVLFGTLFTIVLDRVKIVYAEKCPNYIFLNSVLSLSFPPKRLSLWTAEVRLPDKRSR